MSDDFDNPGHDVPSRIPGGFRAAVAQALKAIGFTVTRWHDDGLECATPDGESRSIGLANLYRRARHTERAEWPAIIRDFFDVVLQTAEADAVRLPDDLAAAADRLLVRLGPPFRLQADPGKGPWQRPVAGTPLVMSLVIDAEKYMTYVTEDVVAKSGRLPVDWLDTALANLRANTPPDWLRTLDPDCGVLWGHSSDSYDAARALILSDVRDPGPGGWLLSVPSRDLLFALPATLESLPHVHLLKLLAVKEYGSQPYPISDAVYWVRGRVWEEFKIEITEKGVAVSPSQAFVDALGLAADEGEEAGPA